MATSHKLIREVLDSLQSDLRVFPVMVLLFVTVKYPLFFTVVYYTISLFLLPTILVLTNTFISNYRLFLSTLQIIMLNKLTIT